MLGLSVLIKHYCITAACELYFSINGEETKTSSGFYGNKASWKVRMGGGLYFGSENYILLGFSVLTQIKL